LPTERPGPHHLGDILEIINDYAKFYKRFDLMIAHPPCTHLAVSGARWFKNKKVEQRQAIDFFMKLIKADIPRIALENPISIISSVYRKPDQIIQPWQHGHGETKATCLWLKNLPLLKPTNIVSGREQRIWKMPPMRKRTR
jgi:site-specific DNA-cytosine methylase